MELFLAAWLVFASPALAEDRCARLAAETCRNPPGVSQSDPTGATLGYDSLRESNRIYTQNEALFTAKARALLGSGGPASRLASKLGLPRSCSATPACRERAAAVLGNLLMLDLSNRRAGHVDAAGKRLDEMLALLEEKRFRSAEGELIDEIAAASDPAFAKKATNLVRELRGEIVEVAWRHLPHNFETAALLDKITKVEYADDRCAPMFLSGKLSGISQIGAFYVPEENRVRVCRGLASSVSSLFALTAVLAHEISHSIDPCTIREMKAKEAPASPTVEEYDSHSPWRTLASCLRDEKAAGARYGAERLDTAHCRTDQMTETIPDFIAAEVMGGLIAKGRLPAANPEEAFLGLSNAWRIGCDAPALGSSDSHLAVPDRIGKILARQPAVRAALRCPPLTSEERYCGNGEPEQPVPFPPADLPSCP